MSMRFAPLVLVAVVVAACGDSGPGRSDVEDAMKAAIGIVAGTGATITVDKAECTSADQVTYSCVTTYTVASGTDSATDTETVKLTKQGDDWVIAPD